MQMYDEDICDELSDWAIEMPRYLNDAIHMHIIMSSYHTHACHHTVPEVAHCAGSSDSALTQRRVLLATSFFNTPADRR